MMLRQVTGLCERTMLRTNKTEAQHVAYKKRLQKPVKMFCMLLTHKPRAPRGFRAEHERNTELLKRSQAKNSLLVRDELSTSRGFCSRLQAEHEVTSMSDDSCCFCSAQLSSLPCLSCRINQNPR